MNRLSWPPAGIGEAPELFVSAWALPELVEAGVRSNHDAVAREALGRLAAAAAAAGNGLGLGGGSAVAGPAHRG